jgi:nucleotide-binding universal stress UspA family protein
VIVIFRNILVCVDGSPQSDEALTQAIDLADCQHSRLTILTAIDRPPAWATTPMTAASIEPMSTELAREARQALSRAVDRVPDCIPVTKILSEDPIRDALTSELHRGTYDLLVLGTRGPKALAASLHGSVSRYAVRRCQIPVLIVRGEEATASRPAAVPEEAPGAVREATAAI